MKYAGIGVIAVVLSACSNTPDSFEITKRLSAQIDGADCKKLRQNMKRALAQRSKAKNTKTASDAAFGAGTALSFVPGVGLLAPLISGAAIVGKTSGTYGTVEPTLLYRESHKAYHKKGCTPRIAYGK